MDLSKNQSSHMSHKGGNLNTEEHSELQVQFPKELLIVDETGNNNANAKMKDIYVNVESATSNPAIADERKNNNENASMKGMYGNAQTVTSNPIEGLKADDMGVSTDMVYLENFPVEDLQHAFQAGLHIDGVEKQDCNGNQSHMVLQVPCKDEAKKVHEECPQNPKLISAACDEQSSMEQKKPSMDSVELVVHQSLSKSASFPCSVQLSPSSTGKSNKKSEKTENVIVDGEERLQSKSTVYSRTISLPSSFKIKSAMRGGQEQNGLGPRPKLSVKWAPDVQEPQISSVSHTVKNHRWHQSKKKDRKHRHKGKSSHTSGSNKNDKKHHSKRSYNSDSGRSRLWSSSYENRMLVDVWASRNSMLVLDKTIGWETPMFNMKMEEDDVLLNMPAKHSCGKGHSDFLVRGSSDAEFPSQGFKCASLFGHALQNKHITYAEAV